MPESTMKLTCYRLTSSCQEGITTLLCDWHGESIHGLTHDKSHDVLAQIRNIPSRIVMQALRLHASHAWLSVRAGRSWSFHPPFRVPFGRWRTAVCFTLRLDLAPFISRATQHYALETCQLLQSTVSSDSRLSSVHIIICAHHWPSIIIALQCGCFILSAS